MILAFKAIKEVPIPTPTYIFSKLHSFEFLEFYFFVVQVLLHLDLKIDMNYLLHIFHI